MAPMIFCIRLPGSGKTPSTPRGVKIVNSSQSSTPVGPSAEVKQEPMEDDLDVDMGLTQEELDDLDKDICL